MSVESLLTKLDNHKQNLIAYLLMKVQAEDWHAVSDAANDIRDVEAEKLGIIAARKELENN